MESKKKKTILIASLMLLLAILVLRGVSVYSNNLNSKSDMNFYDLTFKNTMGDEIKMSDYKDKVVLIVNTATQCGFSYQFKDLERLHKEYGGKGLVVIGFPSNQFLNQEPESNEDMVEVCKLNFGVTFLLSEKIDVNGKNEHPVFTYLKGQLPDGLMGSSIKWNFTKFLIDKDGKPYKRYAPNVEPSEIEKDIVELIKDI